MSFGSREYEYLQHILWREMAGTRDRLIHAYFSIDYDLIWDVVQRKIPELRQLIVAALGNQPPLSHP